jgi:hypothetical protein
MPRKKKQQKVETLGFLRPLAYRIEIFPVDKDMFHLKYEEAFDPRAPDDVFQNTVVYLKKSIDAFSLATGIKIGLSMQRRGVVMEVDGPFDLIASMIVGEFINMSRIGNTTIGELMMGRGMSKLRELGVSFEDLQPMSKESKKYIKNKFIKEVGLDGTGKGSDKNAM